MNKRTFRSGPYVRTDERSYLLSALDSGWIAPAADLDPFEGEAGNWANGCSCVGLSLGTSRPVSKPGHLQPLVRASKLKGPRVLPDRLSADGPCMSSGSGMIKAQLARARCHRILLGSL